MSNEVILNVFPGASQQNRLVLVQATTICGLEHLLLRQETYAADVGWFVQNQVAVEPEQVAALTMTLSASVAQRKTNSAIATSKRGSSAAVSRSKRQRLVSSSPVILQFEAAG